jgi:hypothetical protein
MSQYLNTSLYTIEELSQELSFHQETSILSINNARLNTINHTLNQSGNDLAHDLSVLVAYCGWLY